MEITGFGIWECSLDQCTVKLSKRKVIFGCLAKKTEEAKRNPANGWVWTYYTIHTIHTHTHIQIDININVYLIPKRRAGKKLFSIYREEGNVLISHSPDAINSIQHYTIHFLQTFFLTSPLYGLTIYNEHEKKKNGECDEDILYTGNTCLRYYGIMTIIH